MATKKKLRKIIKHLENLLCKYVEHVGDHEGVDFLDDYYFENSSITNKEADNIGLIVGWVE